jgi:hypothetical protein
VSDDVSYFRQVEFAWPGIVYWIKAGAGLAIGAGAVAVVFWAWMFFVAMPAMMPHAIR